MNKKGPQKKTSVKNMMHPIVKLISIEITNAADVHCIDICYLHEFFFEKFFSVSFWPWMK